MRRAQGVAILNEETQEALLRFEKDVKRRSEDPPGRGVASSGPQAERSHWHSEGNVVFHL